MILRTFIAGSLLLLTSAAWAISPYIQGTDTAGSTPQAIAGTVEAKLKRAGFKVVGKYFPKKLSEYGVVVATDDKLLDAVGEVGGHAVLNSAIRIGVKTDGTVSYTNPEYWARAYFRGAYSKHEDAVKSVQSRLSDTLGEGKGFGGDETARSLSNYRYMVGMEKLDSSKSKLTEYDNHAEAVKAVRENLAKGTGQTAKIYEINVPDKKLTIFGVAMHDDMLGDGQWMKKIEQQNSIAGLPYEIYVVGNEVHSPHARFRIALAFPDVGMGQFMRISALPNEIMQTMGAIAGVKKDETASAWQ